MASNPLVQAVEHFSLAQLMADPNLCRNVLNDIGAQPAEVFLLVAALEARIPHTLIEHSSTNDLSVVEPRLVAELNARGVELSRAVWAVNAWKEVTSGSTLGHATVRPTEPATERRTDPIVSRSPEPATVRPTDPIAARPPTPPLVAAGPVRPPPTVATPAPPHHGGGSRTRIIAGAVVVVLVGAGLVIWLTRSNSKHDASGSTSSSKGAPSSPSAPSSPKTSPPPSAPSSVSVSVSVSTSNVVAPAPSISAPLGTPKSISVAGTVAWTDTGLTVTQGERISITATGTIFVGPNRSCGPNGLVGSYDSVSIVSGQHHGALIGLVAGANELFLVGAKYNGVAPAAGRLYLGINDIGVNNNSGNYMATVALQKP
jgi:hypothetical protein